MDPKRSSFTLSFGVVIFMVITISTINGHPMGESWEEKEGKILNQRNVPAGSNEEGHSSEQQNNHIDLQPSDSGQKVCAARYDVCRTFGPKLLPCCEGFVCKVTYGEQHCVEPWFKISR